MNTKLVCCFVGGLDENETSRYCDELFMLQRIKKLAGKGENRVVGGGRWFRMLVIIIVIVSLVGGVGYYVKKDSSLESGELVRENEILLVKVKSLAELTQGVVIEKLATIEPAVGAPLIARVGGRVTDINLNLGKTVSAGQIVISVDSGVEANPAGAQLTAVKASLVVLDDIEREAIKIADNAVEIAQLSVDMAGTGRVLTTAQVKKSKEQASLAVRQAELSYEDAIESEQRVDQVVRAADIGLQTARLAQEQARIAEELAGQRTSNALKQAKQGLESAKQAKNKVRVDIQSQRVSLKGQMFAAAEQVKMSQVISPISGQITRLAVKRGDFVRPGQEVGEIIAFEGAQIKLDVTTGVRERLSIGKEVNIVARGQEFKGEIVRLADGPRSDMALWQVDIFIDGTPEVVHPGDLVRVELPVGVVEENGLFIPLDVVVVRQDGIVLMTVDENGLVSEHVIEPISYSGDYIEAFVDVAADAMVVTSGNRTLRAGDVVRFES